MSQIRIFNFGDTLTQTKVSTTYQVLFADGVYEGYDVSIVDPQTIELSVGFLMLPDGIILSETTPIRLQFTTLPALPTVFTIVATHVDAQQFGGTAATYQLLTGYQPKGSVANSTVITWIYHPGGAAPLAQFMIVQPAKENLETYVADAQATDPKVYSAPFGNVFQSLGLNHTIASAVGDLNGFQMGSSWPQLQINASGAVIGTPVTKLVFMSELQSKPSRIDVLTKIGTGCQLTFSVYDTAEQLAVISPTTPFLPTAPTPLWQLLTIKIPPYNGLLSANGTWTKGQLWRAELNYQQPASTQSVIALVKIHYDPTLQA